MIDTIQQPDLSRLIAREQEQSVIGALLISNDAIDRIGDLRAEHFWDGTHRAIFETIVKMITSNKAADVVTVFDRLQAEGKQGADFAYLHSLNANTPSAANIGRYAAVVRDRAIKRGMVGLARDMEDLVGTSPEESGALVDKFSSRLEELGRATIQSEPVRAADDLVHFVDSFDDRYHGTIVTALPTGYVDLDRKLNGGLRRGTLVVLAARPKMGKTALALNVANNLAVDCCVLICSMEMPKSQIHERNVASLGRIPLDHVLNPKDLQDDEWPGFTAACAKINDLNLYLDDRGGLTLMQVRAKAKQVKRRAGLDVMVIDYLQLMEGDGVNRNAQIESITRGLKTLAKELDIAIILLSQLNRDLEKRPNKRPQPSDLRDSGSIEQDADAVIFLYRDEVYNPDSMDKGVCEVDISLNRQGASGRVALAYIGEQTRFENLARSWHPAPPKSAPARSRGFEE